MGLDHYGPHDVVRPLDAMRYSEASLRTMVRHFGPGSSLDVLDATAGVTPYPPRFQAGP